MSEPYESPKSILASETLKTMIAGFITAILINLPYYDMVFDKMWNWTYGFPLGWLEGGLGYMITFFHELGHTLFAWFYGYPTLPMFDFNHGGGLALSVGDQQIALLLCIYGAIIYGLYHFKDRRRIQIALALVLIFNIATAFSEDTRQIVIFFMGPVTEPIIAAFLLTRALFDLAPRGWFERFLNAAIGFGIAFQSLMESYSLINDHVMRKLYYKQKGSHGAGDFDQIETRLSFINFDGVVYIWAILCLIGLISPFILYWFASYSNNNDL